MCYRRFKALRTYILYEVSSQLAEMLRKTIYVEKEPPRPSKFIADSSPIGNKAGEEHVTQSNTEASSLCGEILQRALRGARVHCMVHS
jgi:hypothetical protein